MNTEITDNNGERIAGWVFYDGDCHLCCALARRVAAPLARRRFRLCPLQSPDAPRRLGLRGVDLFREMRLLLADGTNLGGADAVVELARRIWWVSPVWLLSRVPGVLVLYHLIYRAIAANRYCCQDTCNLNGKGP